MKCKLSLSHLNVGQRSMGRAWSVYTKASQMERLTPGGPSKWTLTKAPETQERISLETGTITSSSLTWHGRVAGQEQRPTLLEDSREPVTDRVNSEVRPIVANTNNYRSLATLG